MPFENEAGILRRLARNANVVFVYRPHALDEMRNDGLYKIDVENMLRRCAISNIEASDGEDCWRAEGRDNDGRKVTAITVVYEEDEEIKIVTVWAAKAR